MNKGDTMFGRKIITALQNWAKNSERKPLILRGARQVGKTSAVNIFAKEFDQYIYLNLELVEERNLFNPQKTFSQILEAIFFHKNIRRDSQKKTLIFIDEIQNSGTAVAMMRFFYEEASEFFVVGAGSLLEVLIDKHISFPVGRVEFLFMYPLTFNEFLAASQQQEAVELLNQIPIPNFAHDKLLSLFHQYTLLGGMPEVIKNYLQNKDIISLNPIYQNLMIAYADDVEKYAETTMSANYIRHVIQQASLESGKRIKFQNFGSSNYGSKEMGEALRTLEKTMLIYLLYPTTAVIPPIIPNYKKSPRLQFLDTGLLNYNAGLQKYYFKTNDLHGFYQGMLAEHIVGQELIANNISPNNKLNFWVRDKAQSSAELDFILQYNNFIIPIEVKAGKTGTLKSLHQFIDMTNHDIGVRLFAGEFSIENAKTTSGKKYRLFNIPYYCASKVLSVLEKLK